MKPLGKLKITNEFLATATGIITSLLWILNHFTKIPLPNAALLITVDLLNIFVLMTALFKIKPKRLRMSDAEFIAVSDMLHISKGKMKSNYIRCNHLIVQLVNSLRYFICILSFFYVINLWMDLIFSSQEIKNVTAVLSTYTSWVDIIHQGNASNYLNASKYIIGDFLSTTFNILSAAFLFIAFQVLFLNTLARNNRTNKINYLLPFSIASFTILANVFFVFIYKGSSCLQTNIGLLRLTSGIYNGVAMCLLFSRFIAMEYMFNKAESWHRRYYLIGSLLFLPLYVVAQPLYGLFDSTVMGNGVIFKAIVFLVCLWGKIFFLLFVYTTLNRKWVHAYLLLILSNVDVLKQISNNIKDISDFSLNKEELSFIT